MINILQLLVVVLVAVVLILYAYWRDRRDAMIAKRNELQSDLPFAQQDPVSDMRHRGAAMSHTVIHS